MNQFPLCVARNRLSELIRRVESGEEIAITRRGKVVACLTPPMTQSAGQSADDAIAGLRTCREGVSLGRLQSHDLRLEGRR